MSRRLWSAAASGLALVTGLVTCLLQSANFDSATGLDRTQEEIDRLRAVNAELKERVLRVKAMALVEGVGVRAADAIGPGVDADEVSRGLLREGIQ